MSGECDQHPVDGSCECLVWVPTYPGTEETVKGNLTLRVWQRGPRDWDWLVTREGNTMFSTREEGYLSRRDAVKACKYAARQILKETGP